VADIGLAAFYREQALRLARRALAVANQSSRTELMEMAATFQRLATREEELAANSNVAPPENQPSQVTQLRPA
jgi:hypothetical protein